MRFLALFSLALLSVFLALPGILSAQCTSAPRTACSGRTATVKAVYVALPVNAMTHGAAVTKTTTTTTTTTVTTKGAAVQAGETTAMMAVSVPGNAPRHDRRAAIAQHRADRGGIFSGIHQRHADHHVAAGDRVAMRRSSTVLVPVDTSKEKSKEAPPPPKE